jgi:phosphoserine phosphatase
MAKSENKKKVVEYILNKFKPKHSVAFWDTTWDLAMLTVVNKWYCINPSKELYDEILLIDNIDVVIERKDLSIVLNKLARSYITTL